MTLLLDVLESLERQSDGKGSATSAEDDYTPRSPLPTMSIRFFIPRGLYGVWNEAVRRYVSLVSPDDGIELLVNNEGCSRLHSNNALRIPAYRKGS
ncbi:MAG: hypothetical protein AB2L14_02900 [Candidatus Xenobiia bacterium LiM19]